MTQLRAIEILLRKSIPDLTAAEIKTEQTHRFVVEAQPLLSRGVAAVPGGLDPPDMLRVVSSPVPSRSVSVGCGCAGGAGEGVERCATVAGMRAPKKKPMAAKLRSWRVAMMRSRTHYLGVVYAP